MRIISLSPAVTETIFLLGQEKRLVGATEYCNYPPAAKKIPRVGGYAEPSIERIISLKPDLIISTDLKIHPTYARLKKLRLNLRDIETHNVANTMNMIRTVGALLSVPELADARADALERQIRAIRDRHKNDLNKPRVYVEINYDPIFTVGRGSFINEMLDILGVENVFGDNAADYPQVSAESVVRADPDIILLGHGTFESDTLDTVRQRPGWAGIAAVRNGRVYGDVHPDLYHRPGPRIVKGLLALEKRFYKGSSE